MYSVDIKDDVNSSGLPIKRIIKSHPETGDAHPRSVYVIYTGGTAGMIYGEYGLEPLPTYLTSRICSLSELKEKDIPEITIHEWENIMDSSDMSYPNWATLATEIQKEYYNYDGFVIIHGTDTMSYTASALSFMLNNLSKPVIVTGSMSPFQRCYNDARRNILVSILYAANIGMGEVCIFFNNNLMRGNRTRKVSIRAIDAFESVNYPPLGILGINLSINRKICNPAPAKAFSINTGMCPYIIRIALTPGYANEMVQNALLPPCRGCIIESYGSGNIQNDPKFHEVLREAAARGVVIIVMSQCTRGAVDFGDYKSGKFLSDLGLISAKDMTPEACITKLSYLLSMQLSEDKVKELMGRNLRGELTESPTNDFQNYKPLAFVHEESASQY